MLLIRSVYYLLKKKKNFLLRGEGAEGKVMFVAATRKI
jgi:hypothetical protein